MKKKQGIIENSMRYYKIFLFVTALLVGLGIYGLMTMPKQEFPTFTVRQGMVVGIYPGATPLEIEEQLTKPLEKFLFTYKEVRKAKTFSTSRDGIVFVQVELNENVYDKDEVWSKIKHGLALFKMQLPSGVLAVIANDDFGDTSALLITLESEDKTYRELEEYLDDLEGRLRKIESVTNLRRYGLQKEQISVYLDRDKMVNMGMKYNLPMANLFLQSATTSGGKIENGGQEIPIHFSETYSTEKQISDQIIYSDPKGNIVRLRDVARVVREYESPNRYITNNGKQAIILSIEMREGRNIISYGAEVDQVLADFQNTLPESVAMQRIADQPKVVSESINSFVRDLFVAIVIVILVMMLLFPFRSAIVAATSIPISIFISIAIMYTFGIPLNTVTLAALIVVLGMIVDNSIIVIDAYLENIDNGMSRWYAAIASAKNYFWSIFLATLCICIIFFPFLFTMKGLYRDFLLNFPWTLTISLMTSLVVAMLFIPFCEFVLIKDGLKKKKNGQEKKGFNALNYVQRFYDRILNWTFKFPYTTMLCGVATIFIGIFIYSQLGKRLMPVADRDQFAVEIFLPKGTALHNTAEIADSVRNTLEKDERVLSVTSFMGMSSPRFQAAYAPNLPSKQYAQLIVNTKSLDDTRAILNEYTNSYGNHFPNAYVKFKELDYQIVPHAVDIRLSGKDISVLQECADTIMNMLNSMDELLWVHTNYGEMLPTIGVKMKDAEAARVGMSKILASTNIAMSYEGIPVGSMWEGDYSLAVKLKADRDSDPGLDKIKNEYISTLIPGISVQLGQVADISPQWEYGQIVRRNGVRTLSVVADICRGETQSKVIKKVQKMMTENVVDFLPEDVNLDYGGVVELDKDASPQIIQGVCIAVLLVFFFLLAHFKKLSIAITALVSLLLCMLGATVGLLIFNKEFGVTCILGVVSLMGIIVRNVIIMFEHAEQLRVNKNYSARDAAFDAGHRRMLPIFLTSATTAVGVVPMILSESSLWTPMGIVICFGSIISMVLVVVILPVVYWKIYGDKPKKANTKIAPSH